MELTNKLLNELQNRLKVGNRRGVHLNAIPAGSRYKFDLNRLSHIDKNLPKDFIEALLSEKPLNFKISWKNNVPDLNSLFVEEQTQLIKITKSFDNLINQTEAIESEKGINTFGFGFPLLVRRDQIDNKLTVAPILIWSLRIKRTKEFNTWTVLRSTEDPIYLNEVLINHLQSDSKIEITPISSEMLDDGLIDKQELLTICVDLINSINSTTPENLHEILDQKIQNIKGISTKKHFENLPLNSTNSFIEFGGLFSIFEVQKQNIINDYEELKELEGMTIDLEDMEEHYFQPISSIKTDPSQQSILHSLESTRNILIQGPPGTGKSQSLTAILINALENKKKTIVVCEKRTALEVLHKALSDKGLSHLCVLIKDIVKDRRNAVNSVRERIEKTSYRKYEYLYSKEPLECLTKKLKTLIDSINNKHKELSKNLIQDKTWSHIVGAFISKTKESDENFEITLKRDHFTFQSEELSTTLDMVKKAQELYSAFNPFNSFSFINPDKFTGNNFYVIEKKIKEDFLFYKKQLRDENSPIQKILIANKNNPDFLDTTKTGTLTYRMASFFSKRKKETINDQKNILKYCIDLVEKIGIDNWSFMKIDITSSESMISSMENLLKHQEDYFSSEDDIFLLESKWFGFYNQLSKKDQILIKELKRKQNWQNVFVLYYLNTLLINSANSDLPIDDSEHRELSDSFVGLEKEQLKYIKEYWFSKQIDEARDFSKKNPNLSVENLYNKRKSSKHKRLSLREIVKYDLDLFSTFFPVILTTPDVCSNLFRGKNKYFDIVMFDEASQLKLEDNLPALLKGKQIIIAGDEHQMPPSNYFSKIFDGTIEDEDEVEDEHEIKIDRDNILLTCESLLDFASELSFEKKYLDFHYRSKHPFLIDFSNHAFYNKRLKPLPNNFDYIPIKYINVNGTYSDHSNQAEADAVLSIIENNIHRLPNGKYPSVGIATFNISQRNLIKSKIIERRKFSQLKEFNDKVYELEENGLFVKNLENIQGDERDVIILSTTYGVNKDGKFAQRFGPINHKKGYKLLNVIITRAKYKIYVCSSIPEEVFLNFNQHLQTEGANNRRGVLFAYLTYAKAISEKDNDLRLTVLNLLSKNTTQTTSVDIFNADLESPFEEEVYHELVEHFDSDKIIPQVKFAGFRIDLVYDSKIKGIPKIAIECDGASYHSSREAYLYDLHRQNILEGYGFVFHRIWSTNWWRNPKREIKLLVDFIKKVEADNPKPLNNNLKIAQAFTDEIGRRELHINDSGLLEDDEEITVKGLDKRKVEQLDLFKQEVKLTDTIEEKQLDNGGNTIT
jgi:superfamily I DNA and/or RNA helicase/very-short-patch-repair endonuclease